MSKQLWAQFEYYVAGLFGLQQTITSGNKWWDQGDAQGSRHDAFPIYLDCKHTMAASTSFKDKDLRQWRRQAQIAGKRMVIALRFEGGGDYGIIDLDDLKELIDLANR